MKKETIDFHEALSKSTVPKGYEQLSFTHNKEILYQNGQPMDNSVLRINLFPNYLTPQFASENNPDITIIPQKKIIGYSVLINNAKDIDSLFKAEYKKSFRANILRFVNRFETCFSANYKMFYGDIEMEEYNFLMGSLYSMLTNRFEQRNDSNKVLNNWQNHLDETYTLIKEKKASLFVIYDDTIPVQISINHHFQNIIFVSVPSYDLDYGKFALGNVSLYKILEWSVNNGYEIMDMAYGYLEYKRRWSNNIYAFEHHILSKGNGISAKIEIMKLNLKNFLKDRNVDEKKEAFKKLFNSKSSFEELSYEFKPSENLDPSNLMAMDINHEESLFLKKPLHDFLYNHKEHKNKVTCYELQKNKEYLVKGSRTTEKLVIQ